MYALCKLVGDVAAVWYDMLWSVIVQTRRNTSLPSSSYTLCVYVHVYHEVVCSVWLAGCGERLPVMQGTSQILMECRTFRTTCSSINTLHLYPHTAHIFFHELKHWHIPYSDSDRDSGCDAASNGMDVIHCLVHVPVWLGCCIIILTTWRTPIRGFSCNQRSNLQTYYM